MESKDRPMSLSRPIVNTVEYLSELFQRPFRLHVLNPLTRNIECVKKKKTNCLLSKVHKPQKYSIFKSERRESRVLSAEYSKSKTKTRKSVNKNGRKVDSNQPTGVVKYNLTNFRLQRILNNNTRDESIALLGCFPEQSDTDKAVVIFEKNKPFAKARLLLNRNNLKNNY
ncbi:hypothetical protein GQX74_013242 [Glossina fuscipes]|nr:hypothetical protein GQX74_013242 [Glossina fuscipes]